jgi:hypothetical protein
MSVLEYLR